MKSKYRYYGEVSLMGGYNSFAVATMHGYIISQYARLGISLGYNLMVIKDVFPQLDHVDATYQLKGFSMMKGFIVTKIGYRCDLMHTLYTPYFQAEFGYAFPINGFEMDPYFNRNYTSAYSSSVHYQGGPTESIIIGVKRRTQKRISYKLGVEVVILTNYSRFTTTNRVDNTEKQGVIANTKAGVGVRFSLGF